VAGETHRIQGNAPAPVRQNPLHHDILVHIDLQFDVAQEMASS